MLIRYLLNIFKVIDSMSTEIEFVSKLSIFGEKFY